jgi:D-beta-D-heptose 7-phosphate kinase/D-beta-D-heptose 1-phosphate adenosyltransferase
MKLINETKVFVNGSFDVLHYGHLELLKFAASFGKLYIAIDSDERIKEKKGDNRPFHNVHERKSMLEAIKYVSTVFIFDSDQSLITLIRAVDPDIYVIGSDYQNKPIVGRQFLKNIKFWPRQEKYSTTKIMNYELQTTPRI